jgi:uncharacterized protein
MAKQHFFFKLIAPRATFPYDITEDERRLMDEHLQYFQEQFAAGKVLIYGPVMVPRGAFGLAVLEVDGAEDVQRLGEADPSVKAGLNRFEFHPMRVGQARGKQG